MAQSLAELVNVSGRSRAPRGAAALVVTGPMPQPAPVPNQTLLLPDACLDNEEDSRSILAGLDGIICMSLEMGFLNASGQCQRPPCLHHGRP